MAVWVAGLTILALLLAAYVARDRIREEIALRFLKRGHGLNYDAFDTLYEVGTERSVPYVLEYSSYGWTRTDVAFEFASREGDPRLSLLVFLCWKNPKRALSLLRPGLESESPFIRRTAVATLSYAIGLPRLVENGEWSPRFVAIAHKIRSWMDEFARSDIVPTLVSLLDDKDELTRQFALGGLSQMGDQAIPELELLLQHGDPEFRYDAVIGLGRAGASASGSIPLLLPGLQDPDREYRKVVVEALGRIGARRADVVDPLAAIVSDQAEDPSVRYTAAIALQSIGWAPEAACALLRAACDDAKAPDYVREAAVAALRKIESSGATPQ